MSELERRRLHLSCAQELNNSAAMCFEKGLHEEATTSLHNGLKLLIAINHQQRNWYNYNYDDDSSNEDSGYSSECSHSCTLDGCIAFSEQTSFLIQWEDAKILDDTTLSSEKKDRSNETIVTQVNSNKNSTIRSNSNPSKKRRLSHSKDVADGIPTKTVNNSTGRRHNGYVYHRPIRVPFEGFSICQKGYTSLLVVIVFNLAITHQRNVMEEGSCDVSKTQNIAFLYTLCLDLLRQAAALPSLPSESPLPSTAYSTRCEMIIHNNLSQLYKLAGDKSSKQHLQSLQDLLSTLMVLIERGTRESAGNGFGSDGWDVSTRWANRRRNGEASNLVEGILENLDPLILNGQCADAA